MKLTSEDKNILRGFGYPEDDFEQIEKATLSKYTTYEINDKKVSLSEVLKVLDRIEYLSGISRSAFHWSSVRDGKNGEIVYFNSSKLFK